MKVTMKEQKLYDDFTASVFQRGYEKGKEDATISYQNAYNEGNVDGYSRGYDEGVKDGQKGKISELLIDTYIQGTIDVWESIKKLGKLTIGEICEIFGDEYDNLYGLAEDIGATEFIDAIKAYEIKQKKMRENCSILNDTCPYDIPCAECEVHCSVERAKKKAEELKGDKE